MTAGAEALVVSEDVRIRLESFRVDSSIELSFHYFVLGEAAVDIEACHREMTGRVAPASSARPAPQAGPPERFFCRDGPLRWLRDDLYFSPTPTLLGEPLSLAFEWRDGSKRISVTLDRDRLAALSRLVPRLRAFEPATTFDGSPFVRRLEDEGVLVRVPLAERRAPERCAVRLVGHACLLLESPGARVVVDPLLTVRQRPHLPTPRLFDGDVDAIVITHPHWDHFNLDSLFLFDREVTVVIPRLVSPPSIVNIDMASVLRELGFCNIVELEPWEQVSVGSIELTALPFYGEPAANATQERLTLHAAVGGRTVVALADGCHDRFGRMDDVLVAAVERFGAVDMLFAPASGFHYPLDRITNRPFFVGPGLEQYTGDVDDFVRWTTIAGARVAVPYSLFHFTAADVDEDETAMRRDPLRRGSLRQLQERMDAWPDGPLLVLRPGEQLNWAAP